MKVFTKTVELSKAQIEALHTTELDVVAAPKTGYAAIPVGFQVWKTVGGASTSADSNLVLKYDGVTGNLFLIDDVDGTGALKVTDLNSVQLGVAQNLAAMVCSGKAIAISATEAITCAANTKMKVSVDFKIVKL